MSLVPKVQRIPILIGLIGLAVTCAQGAETGSELDRVVERNPQLAQWHSASVPVIEQAAEKGDAVAQYYFGLIHLYPGRVATNAPTAVKWFRAAAEQDLVAAQHALGWMYGQGRGVTRNRDEALKWVRKAADKDFVPAFVTMGWLHANIVPVGGGVVKGDYMEAAEWYEKAAVRENVEAAFALGELCHYGNLGDDRRPEAEKWFRMAAEKGHVEAQAYMGEISSGDEALRWLKPAAERGALRAQWKLAKMYDEGDGVAANPVEAFRWYERVAAEGYRSSLMVDALFRMGVMWTTGRGVPRNDTKAFETFRLIAGSSSNAFNGFHAENALGYMLVTGRGTPVNDVEAAKYFERTAPKSTYGKTALGYLYATGRGVRQDFAEAIKWFTQARRNAFPGFVNVPAIPADVNLAICKFNGWGVERDEPEAAKMFRTAAQNDDGQAQLNLGSCYLLGRGVPRDPFEAFMWFELAAQRDEPGAAELRDRAGRQLTEAQRAGARKRSQTLSKKPRQIGTQDIIWNAGLRLANINP